MQDLDGCLEHLDELEQPLGRAVEPAGVAVGIRIVLGEMFQLADVDLADQRRNVLIVLVAGLGFRNRDLVENRGMVFHYTELGNIALEFA